MTTDKRESREKTNRAFHRRDFFNCAGMMVVGFARR